MHCTYAINLVQEDGGMSKHLDLYEEVQDALETLDPGLLKPFVENFEDPGEFISAVTDLDAILPDLNLAKLYEDCDQDALDMVEAAVRDFLIFKKLIIVPDDSGFDWSFIDMDPR